MADYWGRALVQRLAAQLELHLNELCDKEHCVTPEHKETRELIVRAREWIGSDGGDT